MSDGSAGGSCVRRMDRGRRSRGKAESPGNPKARTTTARAPREHGTRGSGIGRSDKRARATKRPEQRGRSCKRVAKKHEHETSSGRVSRRTLAACSSANGSELRTVRASGRASERDRLFLSGRERGTSGARRASRGFSSAVWLGGASLSENPSVHGALRLKRRFRI